MKIVPLIKAITFLSIAALMMYYHDQFDDLIYDNNLPEKLTHTIYRVAVAFCIVECIRLIIIFGYKTQGGAKRSLKEAQNVTTLQQV